MANPKGIGGQKAGEPGRNPEGRAPSRWQDYAHRAMYLYETLGRKKILEIAESDELLNEQSGIDSMIIPHLANICNGKKSKEDNLFSAQERERLLDRGAGKPKSTIIHGGTIEEPPIQFTGREMSADEAAQLYATALARSSAPAQMQPDDEKEDAES